MTDLFSQPNGAAGVQLTMLARLFPITARPFVKWAGGKSQLLEQLTTFFPPALRRNRIRRYVEPMVGGGAVFFYLAQQYQVPELVICDANIELMLAYRTIRHDVEALIATLKAIEQQYLPLSEESRRRFFYDIRARYNADRSGFDSERWSPQWLTRTAHTIFLNRTCFNGLFRVNAHGRFNVPFGRYRNPTICDAPNLRAVSDILQRTEILVGDFNTVAPVVDAQTLVYFDPPYRPLSNTAHFTAYAQQAFDDEEQLRLAAFFRQLHRTGAKLILSNSDPANTNPDDGFFERAYRGFRIERVQAGRAINRDGDKRGSISELLILNY